MSRGRSVGSARDPGVPDPHRLALSLYVASRKSFPIFDVKLGNCASCRPTRGLPPPQKRFRPPPDAEAARQSILAMTLFCINSIFLTITNQAAREPGRTVLFDACIAV